MPLLYICIEIRSLLSCANVFLQFDEPLTNTEFLKINVDTHAICLHDRSTAMRVELGAYFEVEARTMCNLTVEEKNASFRLSIKNIKAKDNNDNGKTQATYPLPPKIPLHRAIALHCSNCETPLTTHRRYARLLAYPTGSIDTGQFFCHHGPNLMQQLTPGSQDLFYGFHYIVVEAISMQTTTKTKESHVYCHCCLQLLGETLLEGKANKLWAEAVSMQYAVGSDKTIVSDRDSIDANNDNELHNLYATCANDRPPITQLMQHLVHEATLGLSAPPLHFIKLCLETSYPNRQRRYLLIHILEQQLQVLRNHQPLAYGNHSNNNVLDIPLRPNKCCKLLYMPLDSPLSPLLTKWQDDVSIFEQRISPCIFDQLLAELERNALLLPLLYRRHPENDFQPSYVFYDS